MINSASKTEQEIIDGLEFTAWFWFCPIYIDFEDKQNSQGLVIRYRHWLLLFPFLFCLGLETMRMLLDAWIFGEFRPQMMFYGIRHRYQ